VRIGRTFVTTPVWMPSVAADHLLYDIQVADDLTGGGTAQLAWTIEGTRLDTGQTWTLNRTDRVTDTLDIAYGAALRLYDQLGTLQDNPYAAVRIRSVRIDAVIGPSTSSYAIRRVEVSRNGDAWRAGDLLTVAPGDELRVRVQLRPRTGRTTMRVVSMTVPGHATGPGLLRVQGGADGPTDGCDPDGASCPTTFGGLVQRLRDGPRGDDLLVMLDLSDATGAAVRETRALHMDRVVRGVREITLEAD
jgi:hypothetical protein